jgi:predicted DNA-binding transcriptional regulator YafY
MAKAQETLFSRPPLERMLHIHEQLQRNRFPNCRSLSTQTEVSERTIKRDIDFMRDRMKLPIEYHAIRYGYHYTRKVEAFPSVTATEADVFALMVAHKAILQYRGTPFEHLLEGAFRKLTGQLDTKSSFSFGGLDQAFSFRPFAPEETDLEVFQGLLRAVRERRVVRFHYRKLGAQKPERRTVHPYHVACVDNRWYVFAHDLARQAIRGFVLTRMSRFEVRDGRFDPPEEFDVDKHLRGAFGVFIGKPEDEFEVVIEFDSWAADLLRGRRWHWSQSVDELPGGQMRLRMRLNNVEEVERWVLSWGTHATVVAPRLLVNRIEKITAELNGRYRSIR